MNKAVIVGNLVKDPEMRTTQNGNSVTSFTVAVQRKYSDQNGQKQADFIPVVCWRVLAENVAKYCFKGSKVGVVGSIQTRNYDDEKGIRRYVTEIVAGEVEFLNSRRDSNQVQGNYVPPQESSQSADEMFAEELSDFEINDNIDLPF